MLYPAYSAVIRVISLPVGTAGMVVQSLGTDCCLAWSRSCCCFLAAMLLRKRFSTIAARCSRLKPLIVTLSL